MSEAKPVETTIAPVAPMIAVEGGPGSGKTQFIHFLQWAPSIIKDFHVLQECASSVWSMGFPRPEEIKKVKDPHTTVEQVQRELWKIYQTILFKKQLGMEYGVSTAIHYGNKQFGIVDSGLPRGGAYYPGGIEALARDNDTEAQSMRERYGLVIFFQSLAEAPKGDKLYMKHCYDEKKRPETPERARQLSKLTLEAYKGHPNLVYLEAAENPIKKFNRGMKAIQKFVRTYGK